MTEETDKDASAPYQGNGKKPIEVTPQKLLAIILKVKLKGRITDEEVDTICSVFFQTLKELWAEPEGN